MIQQLIAILGSELDLTPEEVSDLLWLTLERQKQSQMVSPVKVQAQKNATVTTLSPSTEQYIETNIVDGDSASQEIESLSVDIYTSPQTTSSPTTQGGYVPLSVPDARSVREPLDFIRALKPLLKKVASSTEKVIDEPATVDWIAQTDIWMPRLQPSLESWLELALVIDESDSMILWWQTVNELQQVLKHYGIFRDVRVWGMGQDNDNQVYLRSQTRYCSPKELIDPQNRRLIMLVSDVTDDLWRNPQIPSILAEWTGSNPVVILQMLPEWMWSRTALGASTPAQFRSIGSSILNPALMVEVKRLAKRRKLDRGINLPVITLEPERSKSWSRMLAGQSEGAIPGYVLRADLLAASSAELPSKTITARERVSNFNVNASPLAQQLAGLLAAAPIITMPVVRLIQDTMLDKSTQLQVAEVFLGGLLKPSVKITLETDPEQVQYEFIDGVRSELLKSIPVPDSEKVFDQVSRYVAKRLGKTLREFVAWLRDPFQIEDEEQAATVKPFAKVAEEILQQLGYQFASKGTEVSGGEGGNGEPILETCTFEVATIAIKLGFNIVTLVPKAQINNRSLPEEIYFREEHFSNSSPTRNRYQSYQELSNNEQEGIDYRIRYRQGNSDVAIVAHHGGKIQTGSTEIADAIAGEDYAFYSFEGLKDEDAFFIPSHKFDESRALDIVSKANRVITIHGFFEKSEVVYLGGLDDQLKKQIKQSLEKAGFTSDANTNFEGIDPNNICNRGQTGKGVQIGISWGLRKQLFDSLKSESNEPTLWDRFVQAIRDALSPLEAAGWRSQTTQGEADYYTEELGDGVELEMISIPGGSFMMGSPDEEGDDSEKPQHQVTIQPFFMGRFQVTQAQWQTVMENNPAEFQDNPLNPVEQVSWEDAQEFCDRLSQKTGNEYRLPTEAEWEYACRAGTETPFHFGETISTDLANYYGKETYGEGVEGIYRQQTTPVGYFKVANSFGLYDMHGNVDEWCEDDWHSNYKNAPNNGSAWLSGDSNRKVIRGGSCYCFPNFCRSAFRHYSRDLRLNDIGFRVVCVAPRTT